ncbi:TraR/DksA C4-type zinc finger protein [Paenibacillus sp. GCM10012307]|uniref:TraR/DksA C4-type zinc finger protein n=1 Tax=Paenibacillus roseus TaxID=2798579 RepID=A0A934MMC8_9BACL|nr:TraR/DksA C4-type zinc finger protein [Paenibacillus roseus]MBJ6363175.1 TraR/DksA C4-type zinc finger protein [Paenibacillus roseus]
MRTITEQQLLELHKRLLEDRQDIEQRISANTHYGLGDSLRDNTGELTPIDNHPGDLATELYDREKDIALHEQEELHLARIEAALNAIHKEEYGVCQVCGNPIPYERLEAMPDTLYCIEHAPRQFVSDARPVEEQYLASPFGRSSLDEREDYNGFDGEDAWQIVEQWGNSDSPAMAEHPGDDYNHIRIEADENDGFVESLESFLATDITGNHKAFYRNSQYRNYCDTGEGDLTLEYGEDDL